MAREPHGCFYYLLGGWIIDIIIWCFIIAFWPISLVVWLIRSYQRKQERTYTMKVKNYTYRDDNFDRYIAQQSQKNRRENEARMRNHYLNQLNESLRIINDTNNISTLFSRLAFLNQLRYNVVTYNDDLELFDVVETIDNEIDRKEEYINMFIIRRVTSLEIQCENSSQTTTSNKFKVLYEQFEMYRDKMGDINISTYRNLCSKYII